MKLRDFIAKPFAVSVVSFVALAALALAGSLTPSASPGSTMQSLANIYDTIAGTFDSSSIASSSTGSLIQQLKYISGKVSTSFDPTANQTISGDWNFTGTLSGTGGGLSLARIGNPAFKTIQDMQNLFHSAGWLSGGAVTDIGGGKVSVDAGSGTIRTSNSATAQIDFFDWPASNSVTIPTDTHQNIGIIYNGGSPKVHATPDDTFFDHKTSFEVAEVVNEGGQIFITFNPEAPGDHPAKMIQRDYETMPVMRDVLGGGLILGESGDGNRYVTMSAGAVWDRLNRFPINALDTDPSSGGVINRYYRDGSGGFTREANQIQWPNGKYDDNTGVLASIPAGKYGVLWFYVTTNGDVAMLYGHGQYTSIRQAQAELAPDSIPVRLDDEAATVLGRIIFQSGATTAAAVQSAFQESFPLLFDQSGIGVAVGATEFSNIVSLSFSPGSFTLSGDALTGIANIGIDYTNGPASRSIDQTITGHWTFSIGASFSDALEATTLKALTLGSDTGLTINPTTALHISPVSGLTNITGVASVSGNLYALGNVGIGTTSPASRLSIVGTTSDLNADSLAITNSAGSPLLYVRNDGAVTIGTTTADSAALRVTSLTQTGTTNVSTVGSSTTVTTTGGGFSDVYFGTKITANGISRTVRQKTDNNTVVVDTAVDWSAGYPFTYQKNAQLSIDSSDDSVSRVLTFSRGSINDWALFDRFDEAGANFYLRNGPTGRDILTITEKGTLALGLPATLASATPAIPANISVYPQSFDKAWFFQASGPTYMDITDTIANSQNVAGSFSVAPNTDFLYLGSLREFANVFFERVTGPTSGVLKAEYWNGSTWVTIGAGMQFSDDTNGMTQSGAVSWKQSALTGWTTTTVNGSAALYWVRISFTTYVGPALSVNMIVPNTANRFDIYKAPLDADPAFSISGLGRVGLGDRVRQTRIDDVGADLTDTAALSVIDSSGLARIWAFDANHAAGLQLVAGAGSVSANLQWDLHVASVSGPYGAEGLKFEHDNGAGTYNALVLNPLNVAATNATGATFGGTFGALTGNQRITGLSLAYTNAVHSGTGNQLRALDIGGITPSTASESAIVVGPGWDYAFVASQGNVGIGTVTPETRLEVVGAASVSQLFGANLVSCTGSNKLLWSNGSFSCAPSGGGLDATADETITGHWTFANSASMSAGNFEITDGYASASQLFGSGLSSCAGGGAKLLWANGLFSCGTDAGSGGGTAIGINESGGAYTDVSSVSFNAAHFNVSFTPPVANVSLDWVNGPASRSIAQTISGAWNFTAPAAFANASVSSELELTGTASVSGIIHTTGNIGIGIAVPQYPLDVVGAGRFGNGLDANQTLLEFNVSHQMTFKYVTNQFGQATFDGIQFRNGNVGEANAFTVYASGDAQFDAVAQTDTANSEVIVMNNPNVANLTNATQGILVNKATTHDIALQYRFGTGTPIDAILLDVNPTSNVLNAVIVNNGNQNVPFRVAGNNDANLLYTDGTKHVGIGTAAPVTKLEVEGTASASQLLSSGGLQVAGFSSVSYSRFGTATTLHALSATNDVLISGLLETAGHVFFDDSASVSANLEVAGRASASATFGSGLTTCNGTFSVLRYDASTGLFTCGTEGGGLRTEASETTVVANNDALNFDAGMFSLAASGGLETNVKLNWTTGPASRSADQTITGHWTFPSASVSQTLEAATVKTDSLVNSTGTLTIGALTLGGLVTGNNQDITGVNRLNFNLSSVSGTLEATQLRSGTIGSDAGMSIQPNGLLSLSPTTRVQINSDASGSGSFELTSATSKLGINAGGATDTTLEVGGAASISGTLFANGALTLLGQLTAVNASLSGGLELTSTTSTLGINAGNKTDTTLEVGGTASISGTLFANGALNVVGKLTGGTASLSGNLEVSGYASTSQLFGAGLRDCDDPNQKLLWTASGSAAGKFSCGYDNAPQNIQVFNAGNGQTWTRPASVSQVYVEVWGAGGGGGNAAGNASRGGGGGGAYSAGLVTVTGNVTVNVGTGGAANSAVAAGDSSFAGATTPTGGGGTGVAASATGGAGGTASGGTINLPGQDGGTARAADGGKAGDGGSSPMGGAGGYGSGGANAAGGNVAGQPGQIPGGGGGGGEEATGTGGAGADGRVIVWAYAGTSRSDLAEWYETDGTVVPGDVVTMSSASLTYTADDGTHTIPVLTQAHAGDKVFGVVSTYPEIYMGKDLLAAAHHPLPIALAGRIPVRVSAANGPIKKGDLLTASNIPGVAIRTDKAGQIIGAALESYSGDGVGSVLVLVQTGYSTGARIKDVMAARGVDLDAIPENADVSKAILAQMLQDQQTITHATDISEIFSDRIVAGLEIITPRVVTDELISNNASISGTLFAAHIIGDIPQLATVPQQFADISAQLATAASASALFQLQTLDRESLLSSALDALQGGLASLSFRTSSLDERVASLSGQVALLLDQQNTPAGALTFTGPITINGGLRVDAIGESGSAVDFLADAIFFGRPYFTADTAGFAVVTAGTHEVRVTFDQPYEETPIVNVTLAVPATASWPSFAVTESDGTGFTISLNADAVTDAGFNWIALAVKAPHTFRSEVTPVPRPTRTPPPSVPPPDTTASASATPEPTPASSPEPTPEATPESTPEATPEPTPVATPEPTPEASPTPTPTPQSTESPQPTVEVTPQP